MTRLRKTVWERVMRKNLSNTVRELSRTIADLFGSYRPELHYMRGAGPKWHAKQSGSATSQAPIVANVSALRVIAKANA
jgi:hypothetical protein